MKGLVWFLLAVFAVTAQAGEVLLVPVSTPHPQFPAALLKERYTGKVFARLSIGNTGTPRAALVIESSHEKFSEAVIKAVGQWRFEPWEVESGRPEHVDITLPAIFGALGLKPFSEEITVGLSSATCAHVNQEVRASKKDYPGEPLSEVGVFWYHRYSLSSGYVVHRVADRGARQRLYLALQNATPKVIKGCAGNKEGKYGDYLPDELRGLLVL